MNPKLILIRGLPGSGKSTLAQSLIQGKEDWTHYEADMFFVDNGTYTFNPALLYRAHLWCQVNVDSSLQHYNNVVVSNTFTTLKELEPYFIIAKQHQIIPQVIHCQTTFNSIHDVPQETIDKMKARWQTDVSILYNLL